MVHPAQIIPASGQQPPQNTHPAPPQQSSIAGRVWENVTWAGKGALTVVSAPIWYPLSVIISNATAPTLTRAENLPKTMFNNAFGIAPSPQTAPATDTQPQEGTAPQFLGHVGSLLRTMIEKGGAAVSKQAVGSCISVLTAGLTQVLGKLGNSTSEQRQARGALQQLISSLGALSRTGDLEQLYTTVTEAAKSESLKDIKICLHGFRLPGIGSTTGNGRPAGTAFAEGIAELQDAMGVTPVEEEPENQDWKGRVQKEKDKLINNTANLLTIKHLYERVCRLQPPDEKFYLRFLAAAKIDGVHSEPELKKLFFEELGRRHVHFLTRVYAKVQYYFYGTIVKKFISRATTLYFEEIFNYIDEHKATQFDALRQQVITNCTRYLTILSGSYNTVAKKATRTGTLDEMVRDELEKKESNLGFETKELYRDFAHIVLRKTLGSRILASIVKIFIRNPEAIVRSVIDQATGSLVGKHGYTHALNCVIREELSEVLKMLQANLAKGNNSDKAPGISGVTKTQLTNLMKNLFEVLRKSQCSTVDELSNLLDGDLLSAKFNQFFDNLLIEDVVQEKATVILAVIIQSLAKEHQLQKLAYKFANFANRAFEIGEEVSLEKMQAEERKVAQLSEQILSLAINAAVDETFSFSGKKGQTEANGYIRELHERSEDYFAAAARDLDALALMSDITSLEARNKINKIVEEALAYESVCNNSSLKAKSSKMSSDNKDEISKRYSGIGLLLKPFIEAVAQLKRYTRTLESLEVAGPHLREILATLPAIGRRLFFVPAATLKDEDIDFAKNQVVTLETHLQKLKETHATAEFTKEISEQTAAIAMILNDIGRATQARALSVKLSQEGSNALREKMTAVKQELSQAIDSTLLPQLLDQLGRISRSEQVDTAQQAFTALLGQVIAKADNRIEEEKGKYWTSFRKIQDAIQGTGLLNPGSSERTIAESGAAIARAKQQLEAVSAWEAAEVKPVLYVNFSPLGEMKGLQDVASEFVQGRVNERLDGLLGFVKRKDTYRYALHHLLLIPSVQAMRQAKK